MGNNMRKLSDAVALVVGMIVATPAYCGVLPTIHKYERPGEKTLIVITAKCPVELLGVKTPSTTMFHAVIDVGINFINNLPSSTVEIQQVCN